MFIIIRGDTACRPETLLFGTYARLMIGPEKKHLRTTIS